MNNGISTSQSGLRAQMNAIDILANNIANMNTSGFKEEHPFFIMMNQTLNAGENPDISKTSRESLVQVRTVVNNATGTLQPTRRDFDIALEGTGYLVLETDKGERYTRNGSLAVNSKSVLTTHDGFPVLGEGGPITLGPGTVIITETGEVFLNKTRVNRLKLVEFDDPSRLLKEGSSMLSAGGAKTKNAENLKVRQGFLEESNVNPVLSVVRMMEIMRQFESIQKSVNLQINDLDAKAIEKLGR